MTTVTSTDEIESGNGVTPSWVWCACTIALPRSPVPFWKKVFCDVAEAEVAP